MSGDSFFLGSYVLALGFGLGDISEHSVQNPEVSPKQEHPSPSGQQPCFIHKVLLATP